MGLQTGRRLDFAEARDERLEFPGRAHPRYRPDHRLGPTGKPLLLGGTGDHGREVGVRAFVLAQGKEAQKRGATHAHFVVGYESALELRALKAFRRHLERLAAQPRYEFGHVNGKFVKPKPAREAAAYLSSYFVAGRGHKAPLTQAVTNSELPRIVLYVSRRLTKVTRATMRNKRRQRHLWTVSRYPRRGTLRRLPGVDRRTSQADRRAEGDDDGDGQSHENSNIHLHS